MELDIQHTEYTNYIVIIIKGDIEIDNSSNLHKYYESLNKNEPHNIIFDLTNVEYVDSSGIGVFISFMVKYKNKGSIRLYNLTKKVELILIHSGLTTFLNIYKNIEDASKF